MTGKSEFLKIAATLTESKETAEKYAEHLEELFDVLLPEKIGKGFVSALNEGNFSMAVKECAAYYRNKPCISESLSAEGSFSIPEAEKTVKGEMREVNVDWTFQKGEIDFLFNPTEINPPVNHEWLWQFNRHYYWSNLARTYVGTRDEKYAKCFEKQFLRWVEQTYLPERWNYHGSAWRTIECGIRLLGVWQTAFDGFRRSPSVSDITLLLMIASMHRQALHLVAHPQTGNWLMMESNGVYTFSALFPELADAEENRKIAQERLLRELEKQILPDGMHDELSPDYQSVVFKCASNFYSLSLELGLGDEVDEGFVKLIESTVDAAIKLSTPGFTQPKTNDTYTIGTKVFTSRAEALLGGRPEYRYVNSDRAEGQPPKGKTPSNLLPRAGFAVMRSDWSADATYLCFDVGPLGMGHMHQDKLSINVFKGNEELLFDDGGGQYEESDARKYGVSGYDHNTVTVDGLAQCRKEPKLLTEDVNARWETNDIFDYASATYEDGYGNNEEKPATHKREVLFCRPDLFLIKDTLTPTDGKNHSYELLFHADTTKVNILSDYENGVLTDYARKYNVAIIPIELKENTAKATLKITSAQTEPCYKGWYVGRNESNLHPATTVSFEVNGVGEHSFITLICPVDTDTSLPTVDLSATEMLKISFKSQSYTIDPKNLDNFGK